MKNRWKALLTAGVSAGAIAGGGAGILRVQARRVRRDFRMDSKQSPKVFSGTVAADGTRESFNPDTAQLPAVAVLGDSWLSGVDLENEDEYPAVRIARGFAALSGSKVRLCSLAAPAVGAAAIAAQVNELLSDPDMQSDPDGSQQRLAVISMGTADVVHPVSGAIGLPILTNAVNRLQGEGGYRVIVLTTPNLGGLPGLRNPVRTVLRRSSRVVAGSQTVAALSTNAVPVSLTQLLSGTEIMSLLAPEGRYPSAFGAAQIASGVITTTARIMDFPTSITSESSPAKTPPAPTEALKRQSEQAPRQLRKQTKESGK